MVLLTENEKNVMYYRIIINLSQEETASKLNYSLRQIQRIQRSAEDKIVSHYLISENFENIMS